MQLYLTVMGKLVDSITVDPARRTDKSYIESKKKILADKYKQLLEDLRCHAEFYLDPSLIGLK